MRSHFPEEIIHSKLGNPSVAWLYVTQNGEPCTWMCRFDSVDADGVCKKEYRPFSKQVDGRWRWAGAAEPRPLYQLDRLANNSDLPVIVVEGEKAADALQSLLSGHVVTTAMHGAQSPGKSDWRPLSGRVVTIWPDLDPAGVTYAERVVEALQGIAADVLVADPAKEFDSDVPAYGWDAADAVAAGWDETRIRKVIGTARRVPVLRNEYAPMKEANGRANDNAGKCDKTDKTPIRNDTYHSARDVSTHARSDRIGNEWPEPDFSILDNTKPRPNFPLDSFGTFWSDWVAKAAEGQAAPTDYVAATLLSAAGAMIGNAAWVSPWPTWKQPPIFWFALIGRPSSHKSPAMRPVLELVRTIEADLKAAYDRDRKCFEERKELAQIHTEDWRQRVKASQKAGDPLPPMPDEAQEPETILMPRLIVSDTTQEALVARAAGQPKGVYIVRDELAGLIGSFDRYSRGSGERAFWLEGYEGGSYTVERKKDSGAPIAVRHLSINMIGSIQPDKLNSLLMSGDDDGFTARMLYVWPDPVPRRRPEVLVDMEGALRAFRRLQAIPMLKDEHGEPMRRMIGLTDEAEMLFAEWWKNDLYNEPAGRLGASWGKGPGMALRLALVLQFMWWSAEDDPIMPDAISLNAMASAIDLVDSYFRPMARVAFGKEAESNDNRFAAALAREILKRGVAEFNKREVYKSWGVTGISKPDVAEAAIAVLEEAGWLLRKVSDTVSVGGRPREDYLVNPMVLEHERACPLLH